ncbi:MAG TPA: 2-oxoacid:acceptor oxidoreductase subunit alpha [Bacteroidales bacterium]|nr:2-oxoacid:acceptor oxidoreductase subunit alpha [Bacteroidales bacterium]HNS45721.1 2-oxoacid:acceptor oxidoreductase subunit alpha [Bacteroidales bacterium]
MGIKKRKIIELEDAVVKFAGDSGDGMQMSGTQFSDTSAFVGNDISTFPDYPSEIRAPQGTVAGVSGFQVRIGSKDIKTPGDLADVLVAMNPAALKTNLKWVKPGATIIIDSDNFDEKNYQKAGFTSDPLEDGTLDGYNVVKAPITYLNFATVKELGLDSKTAEKTKNQFAVGILYWLFDRSLEYGEKFLEERFKSKTILADANKKVLRAGYHFAETLETLDSRFQIIHDRERKGKFRNITGNTAVAWGFIAASERSGRHLFLGSYPITPASEILQELAKRKQLGVKVFQAEDEIAGINSAIGASFTGHLGVTTTSGPGLALKSEALGLAVITELPLVVVDVQRGGPATGLPTKTEQGDLLQALYGRCGESPAVVVAASSPSDCFDYAYMACKIAIEHMTPVILLTDGYLANGSELWSIPKIASLPPIVPPLVADNDPDYKPYRRNPDKLSRYWAIPGQEGLRHRIGSLEKEDVTGFVSQDPLNHEKMVRLREEKVQRVANYIPELKVWGEPTGDLLAVGWGGTYGAMISAVQELQQQGKRISLAQFNYIKPLPRNTETVFAGFKKIIICELNLGQFAMYLSALFPQFKYLKHNKIQGLPFMIEELKQKFNQILEGKE